MKLLIVDDDPQEIELARLAFAGVADVHACSGVIEAMSMLAHESFDLCLVDLRLAAGRSGLELVLNCTATVPFIVLTNFPEDEAAMAEAAALSGCFGLVSKELAENKQCSVHFHRMMRFAILKFNSQHQS